MFDKTNQGQWWDFGWKLVEGCTPVSPACKNCWSMAMEKRFRKETGIVFHKERLERPFKRKKPASFAIWNDLFHESVEFMWIDEVMKVIINNDQHIFQILTKRPEIALKYFNTFKYDKEFPPKNLWIGVTCESEDYIYRIHELLKILAKIYFVSFEPILSEIYIPKRMLYQIDWVIVGPETGTEKRPYKKEWIESLYEQCKSANVPFLDKKNVLGKNIQQYPT